MTKLNNAIAIAVALAGAEALVEAESYIVTNPRNNYRTRIKRYGKNVDVRTAPKIGRNEKCTCGSGVKFKKCCGNGINTKTK